MLEVPRDVMKEEIPDERYRYEPVKRAAPIGDPQDVREAVKALLAAKAPVIVAGQGVLYADACAELKALAELTQVPVLTTLQGKSAFPEDHPLALGTGGLSGPKMVDHFLRKADLVFGVKVALQDSAGLLKPGLPATVEIHSSAAP